MALKLCGQLGMIQPKATFGDQQNSLPTYQVTCTGTKQDGQHGQPVSACRRGLLDVIYNGVVPVVLDTSRDAIASRGKAKKKLTTAC